MGQWLITVLNAATGVLSFLTALAALASALTGQRRSRLRHQRPAHTRTVTASEGKRASWLTSRLSRKPPRPRR